MLNQLELPRWLILLIAVLLLWDPAERLAARCMPDGGLAWFGELVEARVVELQSEVRPEPGVDVGDRRSATVQFQYRQRNNGRRASPVGRLVKVETAIPMPVDPQGKIHVGDRVLITVLPWDGTTAVYGNLISSYRDSYLRRLFASFMSDGGLAWFGHLAEAKIVGVSNGAHSVDASPPKTAFAILLTQALEFTDLRGSSASRNIDVETVLTVPHHIRTDLRPGDNVIVTASPWDATRLAYGNPAGPPELLPIFTLGLFLILAVCLLRFALREEESHGTVCINRILTAVAALPIAYIMLAMLVHAGIWEHGMTRAKRTVAADIVSSHFEGGRISVEFAFTAADGRKIHRTRPFDRNEIKDPNALRAGGKLDVVYIDRKPVYNRPAWSEERVHAPTRKLVLFLAMVNLVAALWLIGLVLLAWFRFLVPPAPPGQPPDVTGRYQPHPRRVVQRG